MQSENGKDIAHWMDLVNHLNEETPAAASTDTKKKGPDAAEKNRQNMDKLQKEIMEQKFKLLNAKIADIYLSKNPEFEENKMMSFDFIDRGDYYEFTMPLNVLFGPKTRKDCAEYWNGFFENCDIRTSFLDNINEAVNKIDNIHLTMKLVVKDGKVEEK